MRILILAGALALTGCAANWTKPGVSPEQVAQVLAQCEAAATVAYPVNLVNMRVEGTRTAGETVCQTINGSQVCKTLPGTATPSIEQPTDVNIPRRNSAVEGCMRKEGFTYTRS